jgi:hypothetical protein
VRGVDLELEGAQAKPGATEHSGRAFSSSVPRAC